MRLFLLSCLLIFAACGTEGQNEQETANAEAGDVQIEGEEVDYSANGTVLKGYLAYDENQDGKRPGVLVVHEWWGHNEYARKRARMLAELGYTALAVDMYGEGKQADHPDNAGKFANQVMQNIDTAEARFNAGLELLKNHPTTDPDQMAAIGYCFGGGVVLHMARTGADLDGVVSFHGSLGTQQPAEPGDIEASILVAHGAADPFVTDEQLQAFKQEMENAGADFEVIVYDGAKHSFTNPAADSTGEKFGLPLAYDEQADKQSWQDMQEFFNRIFQ